MIENERIKRGKMTAYESLKRKENILREASLRAESPDMKELWLAKARELQKKAAEITKENALIGASLRAEFQDMREMWLARLKELIHGAKLDR